jgi:hypothetical protein
MNRPEHLIDELVCQHDKNLFLLEIYDSPRDFGASTTLCSLFIIRLEALLSEYTSSTSTRNTVMRKLTALEDDFRDMGYFEKPLKGIRKSLEIRLAICLEDGANCSVGFGWSHFSQQAHDYV